MFKTRLVREPMQRTFVQIWLRVVRVEAMGVRAKDIFSYGSSCQGHFGAKYRGRTYGYNYIGQKNLVWFRFGTQDKNNQGHFWAKYWWRTYGYNYKGQKNLVWFRFGTQIKESRTFWSEVLGEHTTVIILCQKNLVWIRFGTQDKESSYQRP